ncbi:hypothetical protein JXC34_05225 [Candidatus Woesearchaeota archaeon]|nr:hypothetical protein [Candidatus Woesearchaeota archaeon]
MSLESVVQSLNPIRQLKDDLSSMFSNDGQETPIGKVVSTTAKAACLYYGLGAPIHAIAKMLNPELPFKYAFPLTLKTMIHEGSHRLVGQIAGLEMGKIMVDPQCKGAEFFSQLFPKYIEVTNLIERTGSPFMTDVVSFGTYQQNAWLFAAPYLPMPPIGCVLIGAAARKDVKKALMNVSEKIADCINIDQESTYGIIYERVSDFVAEGVNTAVGGLGFGMTFEGIYGITAGPRNDFCQFFENLVGYSIDIPVLEAGLFAVASTLLMYPIYRTVFSFLHDKLEEIKSRHYEPAGADASIIPS